MGQGTTQDEPRRDERPEATPAAGPHAKPELTNPDATPGTGSLPAPTDGEADPAGG